MPLPVMEITLDKPRTLRYTWGACIKLEKLRGKTIAQIVSTLHFADLEAMRDVVWAGLLHAEPSLTPEAVEPILDTYLEQGGTLIDLFRTWDAAMVGSSMLGTPKAAPQKEGAEGNAGAAGATPS